MASRHTQKLYRVSTLHVPGGWEKRRPRRHPKRSDCIHAPVGEVWAGSASDAIAAVRAQHPQLRDVMLVSTAAQLDRSHRLLTRAPA